MRSTTQCLLLCGVLQNGNSVEAERVVTGRELVAAQEDALRVEAEGSDSSDSARIQGSNPGDENILSRHQTQQLTTLLTTAPRSGALR